MTDSQVSSAVVARGFSASYLRCVVAMELSAQLEARGAELYLGWIPRASNQEAGRLADASSEGFSEHVRVHADPTEVKWLVFRELLRAGAEFHESA